MSVKENYKRLFIWTLKNKQEPVQLKWREAHAGGGEEGSETGKMGSASCKAVNGLMPSKGASFVLRAERSPSQVGSSIVRTVSGRSLWGTRGCGSLTWRHLNHPGGVLR